MDSKVARFSKQTMRVVVFCLAVLVFALLGVQQQANAQGTATLVINTSKQVDVGQPIEITLRITGASDIAGYEMNIRYDSTAAHLYGIHQRSNDLKKGGRDIVPLQVEQANGGVAVGLASCSVNDCVHNSGARNERGGAGNFLLGTVLIGTDEAGPLEIRFDSAKFVDAAGNPVPVTLSTQRVMVQVAQGGKAHPAQPSTWQLPASNAARRTPELRALDRTDDKKVNHADVMELALAWTDVRNSGSPCGNLPDPSLDLNGDGCIDVADVQIAAANTGKVVAANSVAAAAPLTFVVNTANDSADATPGNGICDAQGGCTLRAAIDESNAHPGPDFIQFNIPGSGVKTINLKTNLPTLSDTTGPTTIDGYTQPGASPNTDAQKSNAQIMIQLNGQGPNAFDGIRISSAGNVVRGLALYNLRRSFYIYGSGATNNSIIGNFIGTDAAGQFGATTSNTIASGVYIDVGANGNHIGTSALADRNVISGNARHGIATYAENTDNNIFQNNIIGLSPLGDRRLQNLKHGVDINSASSGNIIGGTGANERNIISGDGNAQDTDYSAGVEISHDTATTGNKVLGNCFGTDVTCNNAPSYAHLSHYGIRMEDGVNHNEVGYNIVGNTMQGGIQIDNYNTWNNSVHDNRIGISANDASIPNAVFGVRVKYHGQHNTIGPNNIIANNPTGILIEYNDEDFNTITKNSIYNNANMGIDLGPGTGETNNDSGDTDTGANEGLNHPILNTATSTQVKGTACGEAAVPKPCTIEIFRSQPVPTDKTAGKVGQGKTFVGSGTTDSNGKFTVSVSGLQVGDPVTATATDATGNTSEYSYNINVTGALVVAPQPTLAPTNPPSQPPPAAQTFAADTFDRDVSANWGSANVGGVYVIPENPSNFAVTASTGIIRLNAANAPRSVYLPAVSAQDVNAVVKLKSNKVAAGAAEYGYLIARHVADNSAYLARLRFATNGDVWVQAIAEVDGKDIPLGDEVHLSNISQTDFIWVRMRITGTNPTTIKIKVWQAGQTEPKNFNYTVKDSTAPLQAAGSVGLRAMLANKGSNLPVRFSFDNLKVTSP